MVKSCLNVLERYLRAIGEIFESYWRDISERVIAAYLLVLSYWCFLSLKEWRHFLTFLIVFFGNVVFFG